MSDTPSGHPKHRKHTALLRMFTADAKATRCFVIVCISYLATIVFIASR